LKKYHNQSSNEIRIIELKYPDFVKKKEKTPEHSEEEEEK